MLSNMAWRFFKESSAEDLPIILASLVLGLAPLHRTFDLSFLPLPRDLWNDGELVTALVLLLFYSSRLFFSVPILNKPACSSISAPRRGVFAIGVRAGVLPSESAPPILSRTPFIPAASSGVFSGCNKKSVQISVGLTAALLVMALVPSELGALPGEVLRLLLIIWSIPLFATAFNTTSYSKVAVLLGAIAVVHALWGISQFILQQDMGLTLIGESTLSSTLPGVAKFATNEGTKLIRAYGPYPHANVLAGMLVLAIASILTILPQRRRVPGLMYLLFPLGLALLLTFSRSGWLGLVIGVALFVAMPRRRRSFSQFHLDAALLLLLTALVFIPLVADRLRDEADVAVPERFSGIRQATAILGAQPLTGIGIGQYETFLESHLQQKQQPYEPWHITPVHSVPLLALAESGVAGVAVISFTGWLATRRQRLSARQLLWLLPLLPLMLFDHYLLTQTAPLLWLAAYLTLLVGQVPPEAQAAPAPLTAPGAGQ